MAVAMASARAAEYDGLTADAARALTLEGSERVKVLVRLRRLWREVSRRDFFPPPERDAARAALEALAESSRVPPAAFETSVTRSSSTSTEGISR